MCVSVLAKRDPQGQLRVPSPSTIIDYNILVDNWLGDLLPTSISPEMLPLSTYLVFRIRGLSHHTLSFFFFYFLFLGDAFPQFERLWQGVLREVDSLS